MSEALNATFANSTDHSISNITVPITKLTKFTQELTFLIFDNELIQRTIGSQYLSYILLLLLTLIVLTLGSYASIEKPENALAPTKKHPLFDQTDKDYTPAAENAQITSGTAIALPIMAGSMLIGMYYFSKKFSKQQLSSVLNKYVIVMSLSATTSAVSWMYKSLARRLSYKFGVDSLIWNRRFGLTFSDDSKIHASGFEQEWLYMPDFTPREKILKEEKLLEIRSDITKKEQVFNYYFNYADIFGLCFAACFCTLFHILEGQKNWLLNNMLAICLVIYGIKKSKVPSFKIGVLLLTLFFFYDIYFVFGTDVMMSVAKNVEIPAKFLIPNKVSRGTGKIMTSMLGLGDLVLPGTFISLCLRYDLYNFYEKNPALEFHHLQSYPKPYFKSAMVGYTIALLITFTVLQIFQHGQPALLYLCPGVVLSVLMTAFFRNEFSKLWKYDEFIDDEANENENKYNKNGIEIDIICSKETLFLAGDIDEKDEDDEDDEDYLYESDNSED